MSVSSCQVKTRKSCSETNTKAALRYRQSAISNLMEISKFSHGLFYITTLAIMQHLRDNEKNKIKMTSVSHSAKFIMGYPCASPYILFYLHGPAILL